MISKKLIDVFDYSALNFVVGCTLLIFSSSAVSKMLYGGASLLPIAVPRFCLSVVFPNVNMLFFNTTSAKSIMVSIETYFSFELSSYFLNAGRPFSCSMFGYNPTTSIVHKITSSGNFGREQSFFRNSLVSLI